MLIRLRRAISVKTKKAFTSTVDNICAEYVNRILENVKRKKKNDAKSETNRKKYIDKKERMKQGT